MGVKGDNVLLAGVHEGTESPKNAAKEAKRTFAAGLYLLSLKQADFPCITNGMPPLSADVPFSLNKLLT